VASSEIKVGSTMRVLGVMFDSKKTEILSKLKYEIYLVKNRYCIVVIGESTKLKLVENF
jgi:hypothetical protein